MPLPSVIKKKKRAVLKTSPTVSPDLKDSLQGDVPSKQTWETAFRTSTWDF
jgi:hypothetical protein